MLFCPCRTWRCRLLCWSRALGVLVALAVLVAEVLVFTGTVHDPLDAAARPDTASTTAMLAPAVQAASQLRPVWDGRHPAVWVGQDPMCWRSILGRHGWARADRGGPRFRVVCASDGPGEFAWNAVTGGAR
jgi:hypothetical protein